MARLSTVVQLICFRRSVSSTMASATFASCEKPFRACLKITWGPAARDFGCSQGGEVGAAPQRAVTAELTLAAGKRPAARRVFAEKAVWLRCSSVTAPLRGCSLVAPRHPAFSTKTGPHVIFRQALSSTLSILLGITQQACEVVHPAALEFLAVVLFLGHAKTLFPKMISHTGQRIGKADTALGIPCGAAWSQTMRGLLLEAMGHQSDHREQAQQYRGRSLDGFGVPS